MLLVMGRHTLSGIVKAYPNAAAFVQQGRNWLVFNTAADKAEWDKNHVFGSNLHF